MINFESGKDDKRKLRTLTAYISDVELLNQGKIFAQHVVKELISQSCILYRHELDAIVQDYIRSPDCKEYICSKVRELIDKSIQEEINEVFRRRSDEI